jgi:hypothetical protein
MLLHRFPGEMNARKYANDTMRNDSNKDEYSSVGGEGALHTYVGKLIIEPIIVIF